jgi:hypothetical protein
MLTPPTDFTDVTNRIVRFIEANEIKFVRGKPQEYFEQLTRMHVGLTLPIVAPDKLTTVVLLKNLYSLWNFVVDDELDRDGRTHSLDATMQLVLHRSRGETPPPGLVSGVTRAFDDILQALPTEPGKARMRDMFYMDLWPLMTGFKYEYCINQMPEAANSLEYCMFTPLVAGISHYLDLDCLFAASELPPAVYGRLRGAYAHIGQAFKLSSDIGTLKRELLEEDNLNLVRIKAREAGVSGIERKLSGEKELEALRPTLQPFIDQVRQKATEHLEAARSELGATSLDTQRLVGTVSMIVQGYFKRDMFFKE